MGELLDVLASRVALDVHRVRLRFNPDDPSDRDAIARLYRHAQVVSQEARDGEVSIVADVPRRLLGQFGAGRM
jgi:hypothetical protein